MLIIFLLVGKTDHILQICILILDEEHILAEFR
jgi:hypothetical protein